MSMPDVLSQIVSYKREEVAAAKRSVPERELVDRALQHGAPRGFARSMRAKREAGLPAVICEVRRASPSAGVIREDFRPDWIAMRYAVSGAAAISVLTDRPSFQGDLNYLPQIRAVVPTPLLRKDFIIDPYQISEARAYGADCILLIAAILDTVQMRDFAAMSHELGMDVLAEVHDASELDRAIDCGAAMIGVNNRDLRVFKTDLSTTFRLQPKIPSDRLLVTESGIASTDHVKLMEGNGVHCFLVGESLMRQSDPGQALQDLFPALKS
jgi:indole-3-glycerol phosphate synthase